MTKKTKHSYKDSLFRYLFQEKEELILLCNAVCGTKYPLDTPLEITTLEDVIYLGIKNDISFILDVNMHLFEHQSTLNPNLPLRGIFYFAQLYRKYVEKYALNVYGSRRLFLPLPRYLVFCNDERMQEDKVVYRLSESFGPGGGSALECVAEVYNINAGSNANIMKSCKKLQEYAAFISAVRQEQKEGYCVEEAIDRAVKRCIAEGILSEFLTVHRAEVKDMVLEEYDYEKHMELERRDARAEGLEEGKSQGEQRINQLILLLLSHSRESDIAKMAGDKDFREQLFIEFGL